MANDVAWDIDNNGNIKLSDKSKVSGEITIPNTVNGKVVTGIANDAFSSCYKLIGITIPNSVTSIGNATFWNCSSLKTINIPGSVTSIADYAFKGCSSLISINIPSSVTSISIQAFYHCDSLTSINIPSSVTSIGEHAFNDCVKLTNVNFTDDSKLNNIWNYAFNGCPLTSIKFTDNDTYRRISTTFDSGEEIGAYIIVKNGNLSENTVDGNLAYGKIDVKLPDEKSNIADNVFNECLGVNNVIVPNSVTTIGNSSFSGCSSLTNVTILNGVTSISNATFDGCSSLTSINMPRVV
ncbi:BspA-like protein [Candidatus Malacoplasma girerdii]|uniref:BspA-like protein n=1 Tax=Candidatus Malacoplasma girerdii TaxID=1318617 RepID=A0A097ST06_9BACT|nr:BspA-like protein [Candidatus Malacoplasma girerdii]ASJ89247.1 MAG: putative surface protein bspA-like [Candidatus Malacoplasma girerdii]